MYTLLLVGVISVILVVLFRWISQPYLAWKRDYVGRKVEPIQVLEIIDKKQNKFGFEDFKKHQQKKQEVLFSLVVPSYNEEKRIATMLDQTLDFLQKQNYKYEIIIINDGSKDRTSEVIIQYAKSHNLSELYLVQYPKNRGKGGAVRVGMQLARGKYHLMVDADGATKFSELQKVYNKMVAAQKQCGNPLILVAGSRHHLTQEDAANLKRKWYRKLFALTFHLLLKYFCGITVMDTQCGFKLFTRESSKMLFQTMHVERWAFDVQLFIMSNHFGIKYYQIPVIWQDVQGSHLNLVEASLTMFRDIFLIRIFYILGLWKYNDKSKVF